MDIHFLIHWIVANRRDAKEDSYPVLQHIRRASNQTALCSGWPHLAILFCDFRRFPEIDFNGCWCRISSATIDRTKPFRNRTACGK
jgi:hypothetical protein